jgi:hypothetical protein
MSYILPPSKGEAQRHYIQRRRNPQLGCSESAGQESGAELIEHDSNDKGERGHTTYRVVKLHRLDKFLRGLSVAR